MRVRDEIFFPTTTTTKCSFANNLQQKKKCVSELKSDLKEREEKNGQNNKPKKINPLKINECTNLRSVILAASEEQITLAIVLHPRQGSVVSVKHNWALHKKKERTDIQNIVKCACFVI
jgi:hypothetical protein